MVSSTHAHDWRWKDEGTQPVVVLPSFRAGPTAAMLPARATPGARASWARFSLASRSSRRSTPAPGLAGAAVRARARAGGRRGHGGRRVRRRPLRPAQRTAAGQRRHRRHRQFGHKAAERGPSHPRRNELTNYHHVRDGHPADVARLAHGHGHGVRRGARRQRPARLCASRRAARLHPQRPADEPNAPAGRPVVGKPSGAAARRALRGISIENLPVRFFCVSANLTRAEEVIHERDELWRARWPAPTCPAGSSEFRCKRLLSRTGP
jgi:hypothetical protein